MKSNIENSSFTLSREFSYSIEKVYSAWTEADQLKKWWGPAGFELEISKFNLAPEGIFLYCIKSESFGEMWGRFIYNEIISNSKLCYINSFSNSDGEIIRAPFNELWPLEISNEITFESNGDNTILKFTGFPLNANLAEIELFNSFFDNLTKGFTGTLDKLEQYLSENIK